jgi:hypothetical protein
MFGVPLALILALALVAVPASADPGHGQGQNKPGNGSPPPVNNGNGSGPSGTSQGSASGQPTGETGVGAGDKGTNGNSNGGGGNFGDVYLQTVGPCTDNNAEELNHGGKCLISVADNETATPRHTPHLPCNNIELMGKNMRDASGDYTLDSIPPSGGHVQVYGFNHDADQEDDALPAGMVLGAGSDEGNAVNNGDWTYNKALQGNTDGGRQVMDVIDVGALVHNAIAAGGDPHDIQGFHFKLQFVQAPQKHKTFWVNCNAPSSPPGIDCDNNTDNSPPSECKGIQGTDCDNDTDNSPTTECLGIQGTDCDNNTDNSPATECLGILGTDCDNNTDNSPASECLSLTPISGVQAAHAGGVLGASTSNPNTGRNDLLRRLLVALVLMLVGCAVFVGTALKRERART